MTIDEWLISIPKDKNEFENTLYLVFYFVKNGQDTSVDISPCRASASLDPDMDPHIQQVQADMECPYIRQKNRMDRANVSYAKAAEYRQKIEGMKP